MNTSNTSNPDRRPSVPADDALPADLAAIASLLDAIGRADRASAPASLTGGIVGMSSRLLNSGEARPVAHALADERDAVHCDAPADLEQSTFNVSRPHLVAAATIGAADRAELRSELRLVGSAAARPTAARSSRWLFSPMRIAAALLLSGAAFGTWWAVKPKPAGSSGHELTENSAAAMSAESDAVMALNGLDDALHFDELDALMAEADGLESSLRGGFIDENELLEQGAM